ncbi:nitrate reductase molybdenum cofactor assembly chaperone, partial [Arthrobacter sp.]|uniref:nitrate reductase molybdenum cofactor assembly chaperone n=1 Tax=Arthrobacter sp. TaxID=1667 RepID=UPI003A905515
PDPAALAGMGTLLDHLGSTGLRELERAYVETYDLSRKHALYLSYWTDGDTRRRGEVLGRFKQAFRDSGLMVTPGGELPDYLPIVLEFAALADPVRGRELLTEFRPSLEMLRLALEEHGSPYAPVVAAVCSTLPGASPADRAAVMAMAGVGPPVEAVGLEPYDARLLPVRGV